MAKFLKFSNPNRESLPDSGTALASAGGRKKESALKQGERRAAEESLLATSQTAPRNGSTAKGGTGNPKGAHQALEAPEGQEQRHGARKRQTSTAHERGAAHPREARPPGPAA